MQVNPDPNLWHSLEPETVIRRLESDGIGGLSTTQVAERQLRFGPNELFERRNAGAWSILLRQLTSTVVFVLIAGIIVSIVLGDFADAIVIGLIVVLNALLGFNQEYRAEKAMAALKQMSSPLVKVWRNNKLVEVSSRQLVPGDLIGLEAGNVVAADCRVLQSFNLRVQESVLTGESEPVDKHAETILEAEAPLGERTNMAFMGTTVTNGRGLAIVTASGMATQIGRIASMIQEVRREPTPLENRLNHLGRVLAVAAMAIVVVIFSVGIARGEAFKLMLLTAVSIAVAAVPEGLPAVVTIALSLGAQRMLTHQKASGCRNFGIRYCDLFRQDRNSHRKPDERG